MVQGTLIGRSRWRTLKGDEVPTLPSNLDATSTCMYINLTPILFFHFRHLFILENSHQTKPFVTVCLKSGVVTPGVISLFICGDKGHIRLERLCIFWPHVLWTNSFSRNFKRCFPLSLFLCNRTNIKCYLKGCEKSKIIFINF